MTETELIEAAKDLQAVHGLSDEQAANLVAKAVIQRVTTEPSMLRKIMPSMPITKPLLGPDGKEVDPPPTGEPVRVGWIAYETVELHPINIPSPEEILEAAGVPKEMWDKITDIPEDVKYEITRRATQRLMASAQDVNMALERWLAGILTPTSPTPSPSTDPSTASTSITTAET